MKTPHVKWTGKEGAAESIVDRATAHSNARLKLDSLSRCCAYQLLRCQKAISGNYELKLDGYRAMAIKTAGEVLLRSRNNKDFGSRYRAIADALRSLPDETIIDGEIVAFDESDRPSFNALQNYDSSEVPIYFYAFDLPMLAGRDLTSMPLQHRRELLQAHLRFVNSYSGALRAWR